MITAIEDYFAKGCGRCARFDTADCATRLWAVGLAALRALCREAGLDETLKWGHPCYAHAGRNVAIIGAFRADFRLTFFEAALLDDPAGLLERTGPNSTRPETIRFHSAEEVAARRAAVLALLAQGRDHAAQGRRAPRATVTPDWPDELRDTLAGDPALAAAFHALTPGRQRSYLIQLAGARTASTRLARLARWRDRILSGKGATER